MNSLYYLCNFVVHLKYSKIKAYFFKKDVEQAFWKCLDMASVTAE